MEKINLTLDERNELVTNLNVTTEKTGNAGYQLINVIHYDMTLPRSLGYQPTYYDDELLVTDLGPIVTMAKREHDNGLYIFRQADGAYLLDVVVPNTVDRSALVSEKVQQLDNLFSQVDLSDCDIYELTQICAHVLGNQIVKPLMSTITTNELELAKASDIYFPRFAANMARYYLGDSKLMENAVNTEPHIVKLMLDASNDIELPKGENHET